MKKGVLKVGSVEGSMGSKRLCLVHMKKPAVVVNVVTAVPWSSQDSLEGMMMLKGDEAGLGKWYW